MRSARRPGSVGGSRAGGSGAVVASAVVLIVVSGLIGASCAALGDRPPGRIAGIDGDPDRGRALIADFGCGACHRVPGVRGARAMLAPPLDAWSRRSFIAGTLPNDPANLQRWIIDPQEVRPGSAMPNLGVSEAEAQHIVAYLFSLE